MDFIQSCSRSVPEIGKRDIWEVDIWSREQHLSQMVRHSELCSSVLNTNSQTVDDEFNVKLHVLHPAIHKSANKYLIMRIFV